MTKSPTMDKWLKTRCVGCGRCCTETIVPVTDADVKRLMKHTGKKATEVVRFFGPDDVEWADGDESWIHTTDGNRFLALIKSQNRCQFLDDANRCTVYDARPMTCRTFPLQIHLNETQTKIENITLNRIVKTKYPISDKPTKTKALAFEQCLAEDNEDERFRKKIKAWNKAKRQGGLNAFLKFVGLTKGKNT